MLMLLSCIFVFEQELQELDQGFVPKLTKSDCSSISSPDISQGCSHTPLEMIQSNYGCISQEPSSIFSAEGLRSPNTSFDILPNIKVSLLPSSRVALLDDIEQQDKYATSAAPDPPRHHLLSLVSHSSNFKAHPNSSEISHPTNCHDTVVKPPQPYVLPQSVSEETTSKSTFCNPMKIMSSDYLHSNNSRSITPDSLKCHFYHSTSLSTGASFHVDSLEHVPLRASQSYTLSVKEKVESLEHMSSRPSKSYTLSVHEKVDPIITNQVYTLPSYSIHDIDHFESPTPSVKPSLEEAGVFSQNLLNPSSVNLIVDSQQVNFRNQSPDPSLRPREILEPSSNQESFVTQISIEQCNDIDTFSGVNCSDNYSLVQYHPTMSKLITDYSCQGCPTKDIKRLRKYHTMNSPSSDATSFDSVQPSIAGIRYDECCAGSLNQHDQVYYREGNYCTSIRTEDITSAPKCSVAGFSNSFEVEHPGDCTVETESFSETHLVGESSEVSNCEWRWHAHCLVY